MFDCVDNNKLWKVLKEMGKKKKKREREKDGNTRPPDPPLEKPIFRSGSSS